MPTVYYTFPANGQTLTIPSGEIQVKLIFERAGASGSISGNEYFQVKDLDYDLSFDSSTNTAKLAKCTIEFSNHSGMFSNYWGVDFFSVMDNKEEVFCEIYIDSALFFSGIIDYQNYRKTDYYNDGATLKYRTISIPFLDKIKWLDTKTLVEASYVDGMQVSTLINNMATLLGLTLSATYSVFNFIEYGDIRYTLNSSGGYTALCITGLDQSENCLKILKELSKAFAFMFYSQNGYLVIESRNNGYFEAVDITNNTVLKIDKIEKRQPIKYVAVAAAKDWNCYSTGETGCFPNDTRQFAAGLISSNDAQNFVLDTTGIMDKICAAKPIAGATDVPYNELVDFATNSTTKDRQISIETWESWGESFNTAGNMCESGMPVRINQSPTVSGVQWYSIVSEVTGAQAFDMFANGYTANDVGVSSAEYTWIARRSILAPLDNYSVIYKMYVCLKAACAIYWQAMAGQTTFKITERGFKSMLVNPILTGTSFKIVRARYDFNEFTTEYECEELAAVQTPTATAQSIVSKSETTTSALIEGGIRVGATEIYNHIHDKNMHNNRAGDGWSWWKVVSQLGNTRYMKIVEDTRGNFFIDFATAEPK